LADEVIVKLKGQMLRLKKSELKDFQKKNPRAVVFREVSVTSAKPAEPAAEDSEPEKKKGKKK